MEDLKVRMRNYAVRIITLCSSLSRRGAPQVIGQQVLRSGTSVGAHYREAIRSRSSAEYAAKMNAGLMELEETSYWIELLQETGIVKSAKLSALQKETNELTAILVSLIKKAKR